MPPSFTSVEAVELLKFALGPRNDDALENISNSATTAFAAAPLVELFRECVTYHGSVLCRTINDEKLCLRMAQFCIDNDCVDAMLVLAQAFGRHKELAREARSYKALLLANVQKPAAVAALFHLPLTNFDVERICRAVQSSDIALGDWIMPGLRYSRIAQLCSLRSVDFESEVIRGKIAESLPRQPPDGLFADSGLETWYHGKKRLIEENSFEPVAVASIETFAHRRLPVPGSYWLTILKHADYRVRCAAAKAIGEYVGIGDFQESTLKLLMTVKPSISPETWLRALTSACVTLALKSTEAPERTGQEQFVRQEMVLSLTQQTHKVLTSDATQDSRAIAGVHSYLDCFQAQNVLYLAFIDMFRQPETVSQLASQCFHSVCRSTGKTPWQVCQPFWPSIALRILKIYDRDFVDWFCVSVLRVSRADFMLRTASLTVPHLSVQRDGQAACEDISTLRGCSLRRLYFDHAPGIIALLFMSPPSVNVEETGVAAELSVDRAWEYAEQRFMSLTRHFKVLNFNDVLASWRVGLIYEVLMLTSKANASFVKVLIARIMKCAYNLHEAENHELLQQTVFRLIVKFSETMRNMISRQSQSTKISALVGLEVLVGQVLTPDLVASVLRQLTAFLQAALETSILAEAALRTWLAVLTNLDDNKLEKIIDLTVSIINDRVESWDKPTIAEARKIVRYIATRVDKNSDRFDVHPQCILEQEPNSATSTTLSAATPNGVNKACYDILKSLVERDVENNYLARQTARDICAFCLEFQEEIIRWAQNVGDGHDLLGRAVRTLLKLCAKNDDDLKTLSSRALGLLGALDSHRTMIAPEQKLFVVVSNFRDRDEVVRFCKMVVKDMFLPAFEAAIDPAVQRYYAYGIQELLKFMAAEKEPNLLDLFADDSLVSTLLPLVKTKYTTDMKYWRSPQYPIYKATHFYSEWLKLFCSDMMSRVTEPENAVKVFGWCRKVLHGSNADKDMWETLFPYAALCAVVDRKESTGNQQSFLEEVLLILSLSGESLQSFHERIFAIVDYFNQWMRYRRQENLKVLHMEQLLARIPALLMAERAFESAAYPRAIRYYEQHLRENPKAQLDVMQRLRTMYATMQDSDNLEGVSAHIPTLSVDQQVLEYEATSQWDAALACYNALPANEANVTAMLECLHKSGRENEVLAELEGGTVDAVKLASLGTECAWTVRDWHLVEKWTKLVDSEQSSNVSQIPPVAVKALGNSLLALRDRDRTTFIESLETARKSIGLKLGGVVSTHHVTSLRQVRDLTVFLHGLADVESLAKLVMPDERGEICVDHTTSQEIRAKLNGRLGVLSSLSEGPAFEARRYLLSLRGAALSCVEQALPGALQLVAETHLEISSAARLHHQPTIALTEISKAKQLGHVDADAEHARLFWSLDDTRAAMKTIFAQIPPDFFENPKKHSEAAGLALEWTRWREITAQSDTDVLTEQYTSIIKAAPTWGKAQYTLAKFLVKNLDSATSLSRDDGVLARSIVYHFSKSLVLGTENITEALPKMLTTWLDLGIIPSDLKGDTLKMRKLQLQKANKDIAAWGEIMSKRVVYTAIPQLLSRQNHSNAAVRSLIEQLVSMVLVKFPFHTLWPVLEKGAGANKIIAMAIKRSPESAKLNSLIASATVFVEKLKVVCAAKPKPKVKQMRVVDLGEDFSVCLHQPQLAVPVQAVMNSLENVQVYDIEEYAAIQQSLQRPKRITVWGTNGQKYQLLLKGNDDVRKDARLIEFTTAASQLLQSDPASSARYLEIITYRVTPLNERAGIIEWVQGAKPARSIIQSLSNAPALGADSSFVKRMINVNLSIKDRLAAFKELESTVPPVLYEWFLHSFPDPEAWLNARTRYSRSLAVMSMVGYVLGLGDRHLENILLIESSGSVLHVDFDCIFNKGEKLNVPELVPFRLTQQFRDALGIVNGYEGPFRKVSELTLKILRDNEDLLMVILESFVYDPVVQDRSISLPVDALANARARIRGIMKSNAAPLGVSGLVDELIHTATSPERLCRMFRGWMPWI